MAVVLEVTERVEILSKARVLPIKLTAKLVVGPVKKVVELGVFSPEVPDLEILWVLEVLAVGPEFAVGATVAEVTAKANSKALFAEWQQLPLPFASQQNSPSGMTELLHWTTNLLAPDSPRQRALAIAIGGRVGYPCRIKGR